MDNISLSFRIAVNTNINSIIEIIKKYFEEVNNISPNTPKFRINKNYAVISSNDDFNLELASDSEDDFLYYESNIDFFTSEPNITLNEQILFANKLVRAFRENYIKSEIVSEFEHLL